MAGWIEANFWTVVATHISHLSPDSKVDAQLLFTA